MMDEIAMNHFESNTDIVNDGAGSDGELSFAGRLKALIKALQDIFRFGLTGNPADLVIAANRAADAIWPPHSLKK